MDHLSLDVGACDVPWSPCKALVVAEYGPGSFYSRHPDWWTRAF